MSLVPVARAMAAAAAIALAAASAQPLVTVRSAGSAAGSVAGSVDVGATALPGLSVAWGLAAAGLLVGLIGGRLLLNLSWVLQVMTGLGIASVALWRLGRLSEALLDGWATQTGVSTTTAALSVLGPHPTAWYWVALVSGVVLALAGSLGMFGALGMLGDRRTSGSSLNHPDSQEKPSQDPREVWAALNRGEDPTL